MSQRFFEELASMKLAQSYPEDVKRSDYLADKIDAGDGTGAEKFEQAALDRKFQPELRRIILHYKLNWLYMSRNIKDKLQAELTAHQENLKGTKGSLYSAKPKGVGA